MSSDSVLAASAQELAEGLQAAGLRAGIAESCTGGWIAKCLTDIAGSSQWFEAGLVCYSNTAKQRLAGVEPATLNAYGAVSEPVAAELARGAVRQTGSDVALAVTGIAGPSGGTADKPVGLVWFGWCDADGRVTTQHAVFDGDREAVRRQTVARALDGMNGALRQAQ
jgi:nicotinamide-nucleotide amidase